jgi:hypothetical protein
MTDRGHAGGGQSGGVRCLALDIHLQSGIELQTILLEAIVHSFGKGEPNMIEAKFITHVFVKGFLSFAPSLRSFAYGKQSKPCSQVESAFKFPCGY